MSSNQNETVATRTIRAIFAHPGRSNKEVSDIILAQPGGGSTDKTVAWYRAHMKKGSSGKLGVALVALVNELGGPGAVPGAVFSGNTSGGRKEVRTMSHDDMARMLRAAGYDVAREQPLTGEEQLAGGLRKGPARS